MFRWVYFPELQQASILRGYRYNLIENSWYRATEHQLSLSQASDLYNFQQEVLFFKTPRQIIMLINLKTFLKKES